MKSTNDALLCTSPTARKIGIESLKMQLDRLSDAAMRIDARARTPGERIVIVPQVKKGKHYDPVVMYYPTKSRKNGKSLGKVGGPGHREFLLGQKKTALLKRLDKLQTELYALQNMADQIEAEVEEWTES